VNSSIASAEVFCSFANKELSQLGFTQTEDSAKRFGNYGDSRAIYSSESGFLLNIGFAPSDGRSASIRFGRLWVHNTGYELLSNYLFAFAHKYGISLPSSYRLEQGESEVRKANQLILADLTCSLPIIADRLTQADLKSIEEAEYGVCRLARKRHGDHYLESFTVSAIKWRPIE